MRPEHPRAQGRLAGWLRPFTFILFADLTASAGSIYDTRTRGLA